jgi:carbon-monoxide dehydrogenase small subunit
MTIKFILNGEDVSVKTEGETRLIEILRGSFKLMGAKAGCLSGRCGACFVLFDGRIAPSCLIPAFQVRDREIITIEGFIQTNEYRDIAAGFAQAQVETCGYCETAKVLAAEALLEQIPRPSRQEILAAYRDVRCRCTEPESLVAGVQAVADIRQRRLYGRGA